MTKLVNRTAEPSTANGQQRELIALLRSIASGDQRALRPLYEKTSAKLYGICLRLVRDPDEAEDVLQNVYLTVWRKADAFDPSKAAAVTWLATLARNKAIDRLRQRPTSGEGIESADELQDNSPSPLHLLEAASDNARLNHCLEELDERARAMIRAAFLDGATYPQLAERERVPLPTMKSWIRRGLLRLRECMER